MWTQWHSWAPWLITLTVVPRRHGVKIHCARDHGSSSARETPVDRPLNQTRLAGIWTPPSPFSCQHTCPAAATIHTITYYSLTCVTNNRCWQAITCSQWLRQERGTDCLRLSELRRHFCLFARSWRRFFSGGALINFSSLDTHYSVNVFKLAPYSARLRHISILTVKCPATFFCVIVSL